MIVEKEFNNKYSEEKKNGATFTPKDLSDFVAKQIVCNLSLSFYNSNKIKVLDPAIGEGALICSLLEHLSDKIDLSNVEIYAFEINRDFINRTEKKIKQFFPDVKLKIFHMDFLDYIINKDNNLFFTLDIPDVFDIIIANPPYVRTQVIGQEKSQYLAKKFNISGKIDLYHVFILSLKSITYDQTIGGIIVSNKFMTTKTGSVIRDFFVNNFNLLHIWDFGDTKLFKAAVLPAVILFKGRKDNIKDIEPLFTSVYEINNKYDEKTIKVNNVFEAINYDGCIETIEGKKFLIKQGFLDVNNKYDNIWKLTTNNINDWLNKVEQNTWKLFKDVFKIKVGIKTCADKVFIRDDWDDFLKEEQELLKPIVTHHVSDNFKSKDVTKKVLYPYDMNSKIKKVIDINKHPEVKKYLEKYRNDLEKRSYLIEAGRKWYEIWVPHNPYNWRFPKIIFRDISKKPIFWIDFEGSIVNGDCYWMINVENDENLLWLALAISNSSFIEQFYDYRFNNKLFNGRRRFITQYVEKFPLPDPYNDTSKKIISIVKEIYNKKFLEETKELEEELDVLVWKVFGLNFKKNL